MRRPGSKLPVWSKNSQSRNEKPLTHVTHLEAHEMVQRGEAVEVKQRSHGQPVRVIGIQLRSLQKKDHNSPCHITAREMFINGMASAGLGADHEEFTPGFIDEAQAKITLWPEIGDDKAVRVRPVAR